MNRTLPLIALALCALLSGCGALAGGQATPTPTTTTAPPTATPTPTPADTPTPQPTPTESPTPTDTPETVDAAVSFMACDVVSVSGKSYHVGLALASGATAMHENQTDASVYRPGDDIASVTVWADGARESFDNPRDCSPEPTATPTDTQTPTATPTPRPTATATPTPTPTPIPEPTAAKVSVEASEVRVSDGWANVTYRVTNANAAGVDVALDMRLRGEPTCINCLAARHNRTTGIIQFTETAHLQGGETWTYVLRYDGEGADRVTMERHYLEVET